MPKRPSPHKILKDHQKDVRGIHVDADFLYTWGPGYVPDGRSSPVDTVFVYDKKREFAMDGMLVGFGQDILCATSTSDRIVVGGGGGKDLTGYRFSVLRLYNKETQLLEQDWGGDEYRVTSLFADDGYVYAGTSDSWLLVHDKATMREVKTIRDFVDQSPGTHVAADGSCLYCGAPDGAVRVWSKATWTPEPPLRSDAGMMTHVIVNDNRIYGADGSGNLVVWNASTPMATSCFRACDGPARGMALSGKHAFIGDARGTISAWDAGDLRKTLSFVGRKVPIAGIHADDQHLFASYEDGAVLVWAIAELLSRKNG
ncbi:MAG: hypothetical protein JW839_05295 [Candidatus Lokiarchaeota archaeon]|nr:hypothetical protein [Candidatus Lokiarchaeota archaeon]